MPWLSISACSINRPDTPVMSVATEDSLIPADSNSFSNRWISRVRPWVIVGPGPGQVPQLPDRFRWHERGPDQAVGTQIGQPGGIGDIRLAARDVLARRGR